MSTTIKYENYFGSEISVQQIQNIDSFLKIFLTNNIPSKVERYDNGELVNTTYIVSTLQEIDAVLEDSPSISFEYTYVDGNYKIVEYLSYDNGILTAKSIHVYSDENEICFKVYKLESGNLIHFSTEKYYSLPDGTEKYKFEYDENGNCYIIHDEEYHQSDIYAWNIGVDPDVTFTWTGFEYYQFVEPTIPSN
jgi:hypothetical protein